MLRGGAREWDDGGSAVPPPLPPDSPTHPPPLPARAHVQTFLAFKLGHKDAPGRDQPVVEVGLHKKAPTTPFPAKALKKVGDV